MYYMSFICQNMLIDLVFSFCKACLGSLLDVVDG